MHGVLVGAFPFKANVASSIPSPAKVEIFFIISGNFF